MKKKVKKLRLSKETVYGLDLGQAMGAAGTARCQNTNMSICLTNCPTCGDTHYQTCFSNATDCFFC